MRQLTASLGQSHTVVGQGLVDTALSQRPEERRGLFEHAADLTGLRLKAAEADATWPKPKRTATASPTSSPSSNRVAILERAARQANEYRDLLDRLRALQGAAISAVSCWPSPTPGCIERAARAGESTAEAGRDPA